MIHRSLVARTAALALLAAVLTAAFIQSALNPASGQTIDPPPPTPPTRPVTDAIRVRTIFVVPVGIAPQEQACFADAVVVVADGRIQEIRAEAPRFDSAISDNLPALTGETGAFIVSVSGEGAVERGPRDCVDVTR